MNAQAQQRLDTALAAARDRVSERAAQILANPDVIATGRWWRELEAEISGASSRRARRAIKAWEQHVTCFLENIEVAVEFGFGDRDSDGLKPTDWRAGI
jgi:hypothetical protein